MNEEKKRKKKLNKDVIAALAKIIADIASGKCEVLEYCGSNNGIYDCYIEERGDKTIVISKYNYLFDMTIAEEETK